MVFSSIIFLFFFLPVVIAFYFLLPGKTKNLFLFIASIFFYAWGEGIYVFVMLASISSNYLCGLLVDKYRHRSFSLFWLSFGIILNLGCLSVFKYLNFIIQNINTFFASINLPPFQVGLIHLPIGISFFTFQAMSYLIDVYKKEGLVQRNLINLGLYISLFPQLIAGPIIRYHDVAKQIAHRTVNRKKFAEGAERFVFGLGKKILIANQMGMIADQIFLGTNEGLSASVAWLGILCYTLQIYFDFSGYSDMAIGLGRMFGFRFLENFNYPYISQSIQEFWRRWHISLSNWFRDYLYIPLGGNRKGPIRIYFNLIIVFLLCGLWHGASWNFIFWGLWHGLFLVIERLGFTNILEKAWIPFRHIYVLFVVMIGWVFFRAENLSLAFTYLSSLSAMVDEGKSLDHYMDKHNLTVIIAACIFSMPIYVSLKSGKDKVVSHLNEIQTNLLEGTSAAIKLCAIYLVFHYSVLSLAAGAYNPFIYFRF